MADRKRSQDLLLDRSVTHELSEELAGRIGCIHCRCLLSASHLGHHLSSECLAVPLIEQSNTDIPSPHSWSAATAITTAITQQNAEASFDLSWESGVGIGASHDSASHIDAHNDTTSGDPFFATPTDLQLEPYLDAPPSGIFEPYPLTGPVNSWPIETSDVSLDTDVNGYLGMATMVPLGSSYTASFPGLGFPTDVSPNELSFNALFFQSSYNDSILPSSQAQLGELQVSTRASQAGTSASPRNAPMRCIHCYYSKQKVSWQHPQPDQYQSAEESIVRARHQPTLWPMREVNLTDQTLLWAKSKMGWVSLQTTPISLVSTPSTQEIRQYITDCMPHCLEKAKSKDALIARILSQPRGSLLNNALLLWTSTRLLVTGWQSTDTQPIKDPHNPLFDTQPATRVLQNQLDNMIEACTMSIETAILKDIQRALRKPDGSSWIELFSAILVILRVMEADVWRNMFWIRHQEKVRFQFAIWQSFD